MEMMSRPIRVARATLSAPLDDGGDRNVMPMQTLIGIDADPPNFKWLIEASWDGERIGDIHVYMNENAVGDGSSPNMITRDNGEQEMVAPKWVWWAGVPCAKVGSYRLAGSKDFTPGTAPEEPTIFELPVTATDAERQEKPRSTGEGGRRARSGEERG